MGRRDLTAFDHEPVFAKWICTFAGLDCVVGRRQPWTVGEDELKVELQVDRDRSIYVFFVRAGWSSKPVPKSLILGQVYAIARTRCARAFKRPELARFKLMALIDAGLVEPDVVRLPALEDAPPCAVATWELVEYIATVRATNGDTGPMPLVAPWLASLNGTTESTIKLGKEWLAAHDWIVHVDNAPGSYGRETMLWQINGAGRRL